MSRFRHVFALSLLLVATGCAAVQGTASSQAMALDTRPWMNRSLGPERRAELLQAQMTQEEKLRIISGWFGSDQPWSGFRADPLARYGSAGFVPGVERLGIPPQWQTDAGVGVATQGAFKDKPNERTAIPSGISLAASWNPDVAYAGGAMIGAEARASGFNEMLAGGVNLVREPRNGRTFEYGGEDPLLAGTVIGAAVRGIESNQIISMVKHYAFNDQETGRGILNVVIDKDQARMSDLLAFEIAIEASNPGSVMCAYNKVLGDYSCENDWLTNTVLKGDWRWKGFVMSDWSATHSTEKAALAGHDMETGLTKDEEIYFGAKLAGAIRAGRVPQARLDDMARRVLWAMFAKGVVDNPVAIGAIDYDKGAAVSRAAATEGAVLLKNENAVLPLSAGAKKIAVIGGHADIGVLSGGGSAQVYGRGGMAVRGLEPTGWPGPVVYHHASPLKAIQARAPGATVAYVSGSDAAAAARLARESDVVLVFANQWMAESRDFSLTLPDNQDALVAAVAAANPKTVVVLQTGGPVLMPWIDQVAAVLEVWYPGTNGAEAIGDLLFGQVNPSGRLPVTFVKSADQLPRPKLDGEGLPSKTPFDVNYFEGAAVGYRWFDARSLEPAFPFGHGLSYTSFAYSGLAARRVGDELVVSFRVRNTGARPGKDVPQVYVGPAAGGWEAPRRLGGFRKVDLAPGAETTVSVTVDPRLLAVYDSTAGGWRRPAGEYVVWLGASSRDLTQSMRITLPARLLPPTYNP